jgi:serine/threonine protein kinase
VRAEVRVGEPEMDQYKLLGHIGEGAHGVVVRGKHRASGQDVALKKLYLKRPEEEVPIHILREVKLLQKVQCKYVRKALSFCSILNFLRQISPTTNQNNIIFLRVFQNWENY